VAEPKTRATDILRLHGCDWRRETGDKIVRSIRRETFKQRRKRLAGPYFMIGAITIAASGFPESNKNFTISCMAYAYDQSLHKLGALWVQNKLSLHGTAGFGA